MSASRANFSLRLACASFLLGATYVIVACSMTDSGISARLTQEVEAGVSPIDMARVLPSAWTTFCAFSPYTTNERVQQALGFAWDAERYSSIESHEGVKLLVFADETRVMAFAEHPRRKGDFRMEGSPCLERSRARFVPERTSADWVDLVPG